MTYENITYEKRARIARITLNRPEKVNAISLALMEELRDALFDQAGTDSEVRVVIIKGAGRAFCGGFDAAQPALQDVTTTVTISDDLRHVQFIQDYFWRLRQFHKPMIAQVHGFCMAVGTLLCMSCDIIMVAENAQIGNLTAPLGAGIMAADFARLIGTKRAKEFTFILGNRMDGKEAERIGWANHAVPEDKLEEEVNNLAERIAKTPLELLIIEKLGVNRLEEMMGLRNIMMATGDLDVIAHYTPAIQGFITTIKEKGVAAAFRQWGK